MISPWLTRTVQAVLVCAALSGCFPGGHSQSAEENEAHFKAGRARVNSMDFAGAIEAFEKALEVNPHSAAAHFELGWLFADKEPNPAAAIYHYEQFLKLRPNAENAETIKQHIFRLKQELAKAVYPLPPTPGVQRELDQLVEQNRQLREENGHLRDEVQKWRTYYASQGANKAYSPNLAVTGGRAPAAGGGDAMRTHKVQPGETPTAIARKYGIKVESLMAANPGLNPRRLQVGQSLNVPGS